MPDIHQPGHLISLPLLSPGRGDRLERDLAAWTRERPLALVLPCHVRDLNSAALTGIVEILAETPWISNVVVGLDGTGPHRDADASRQFRSLEPRCEILYHDPASSPPGKGRNLRDCVDHLLRSGGLFAVAMHDCDILTYSRDFLARLCWPVLHPEASVMACKGYYARNSGRLHGRVFRLMFQPLLRAWAEMHPGHPWPAFLQSLRYPLSGELCVQASLLSQLSFDPGWGVEVGLLHGLYRLSAPRAICQAELCTAYDHKHHDAGVLTEMAAEVARALSRSMEIEGVGGDSTDMQKLLNRYELLACEAVRESELTAYINGLEHDGKVEAALTAVLAKSVRAALD